MIPKECKRLIEVDFPIAVVSKHSAREKSIRHGHPSTLHLWWARRPLAACRAVLMGLLLPDPCDKNCPGDFKSAAREILLEMPNRMTGWTGKLKTDEGLQKVLLEFIGDFSNWDLSSDPSYLKTARGLVRAAHPEETPLVVDPFAGGGSIPLEALRLGCEAFASDLNPVACLILKVMLEDIPRHGPGLADELLKVGKEIREAAEKELAEFYPVDPDGSRPIAYLWARTVRCEAPNCGAEMPLMRSFWLCKKANRKRALRCKVIRAKAETPRVELEIFEPKSEDEVPGGTVTRAKATCLCCGAVLAPARVRAQLYQQRGGADAVFDKKGSRVGGACLLAVVSLKAGEQGRHYRLATDDDYQAVWEAQGRLGEIIDEGQHDGREALRSVPDEPLPWKHGHRSIGSPRVYGMKTWGHYFTARQKVGLAAVVASVQKVTQGHAEAKTGQRELLSLVVSKLAELACANCRWEPVAECPRSIFTRHDLPATWDFAEGVLVSDSSGSFGQALDNLLSNIAKIGRDWGIGQAELANACSLPLAADSADIWFTDPPYYDAVAYADLSDFFFVWLKRLLPGHRLVRDPFDPGNPLVPKEMELTVTTVAGESEPQKTKDFFENGIMRSFREGRRLLREDGVGCVVFAHKTTEGWEALLGGILSAGWVIGASWPIATEMGHRFNARDVAALAGSVHLVCRPRPEDARVADWGEVFRELPNRVGDWMERLQREHIRGADLVFACIGPALEIYSRYSKVVDAQDREIPLGGNPEATEPHKRGFLSYVWEVVGRTALGQILGTAEARARNRAVGALEEDARLTALFLWTLQSTNAEAKREEEAEEEENTEADEEEEEEAKPRKKAGYTLIYDVVRRFAQPLGIHLEDWEDRIIKTEKGVVRLLPVRERAKQLFGEAGAEAVADQIEEAPRGPIQLKLFTEEGAVPEIKGRMRRRRGIGVTDEQLSTRREATTLDRVHAAMLLQASGRTNALRALLKAEQERGPEFIRLANALSALYHKDSEEKRLLDAMLLAMPRR